MLFLFVWVFVWPEAVAEIHASLSRLAQEVFYFNISLQHHVLVAWVQEAAVYILRRHLWEQAGD
jgi:hypothetical protein